MSTEIIFRLAPWVVLAPLAGLLVNFLIGRRLGERGVGAIATLASLTAFVVAVLLAMALGAEPEGTRVVLAKWIQIDRLDIDWAFRVDTLSVTMMLVVSGVGTLIHLYSIGYMHSDVRHNNHPERFRRFFLYLNLFIAFMMVLVSADNFLMLFVGWEGVGLCSYLLIGFWFERGGDGFGNARAAKKAFIVNRIGDFGLLIAMFLIFWIFGSLRFDDVFALASQASPGVLLAITLFMLLGVTGKSAQLPLYVWLPDAMAGPTPVSALIHAATMVTAGVYLVARAQPLFGEAPAAQFAVVLVGSLTALFAATIAVAQFDIKKVLAYSTISQLGFMVAAVGMGATVAGMFHLVTHAFFKALLFLGAGSVILGMEHAHDHQAHGHAEGRIEGHSVPVFDPQDMRNMGGLRRRMPTTFAVYLIGALALAGIPPLSGFFSKDEILGAALAEYPFAFVLLLIAAFLTAFYMGRQLALVFFGPPRTEAAGHAEENGPVILFPLAVLSLLAIFGGLLNLPNLPLLAEWLEHSVSVSVHEAFNFGLAGIAAVVALAGLGLGWLVYGRNPLARSTTADPLSARLGELWHSLSRKWYVDEVYQAVVVRPYQRLAGFLAGKVDMGFIDAIVNGAGYVTRSFSGAVRTVQNGLVRSYALMMLVGVTAIFAYLLLR